MSRAHSSRRVFLIGFMGAGKTSVGQALAARLGWRFCDLDRLIEQRAGKKVAAIFADDGEAVFRAAESEALEELLNNASPQRDLIVALGGGAFVQLRNRERLEQAGAITVLLEAPLEELRLRCKNDETVRPLARDEARFAELFAVRQPAYQLAQHKVNTAGKAVEDVAAEIVKILTAAMPEVKQ
jgi:shikimate kinase